MRIYMNVLILLINLTGIVPPGAGFMNRRRLCQLTAAILTSDLTTRGFYEVTQRLSCNYTAPR